VARVDGLLQVSPTGVIRAIERLGLINPSEI
jgi:hypothetical protein